MHGIFPLIERVCQLRRESGPRQIQDAVTALVCRGTGGTLSSGATSSLHSEHHVRQTLPGHHDGESPLLDVLKHRLTPAAMTGGKHHFYPRAFVPALPLDVADWSIRGTGTIYGYNHRAPAGRSCLQGGRALWWR